MNAMRRIHHVNEGIMGTTRSAQIGHRIDVLRGVGIAWLCGLAVLWAPAPAYGQNDPSAAPHDQTSVQQDVDDDAAARPGGSGKPWNQGVPRPVRQKAREIFLEGNRYLQIPLFAQAAEKYQEALALWQHPAFHYNLALAQLNLVQPVAAYESLQKAMEYGAAPLGENRYRQARDYRRRLQRQLGHIAVACAEPGARVTLDGRLLFTGPGRYRGVVAPGNHQLLASKKGLVPETRQVVLSPGQRAAIELVPHVPDRVGTERYLPAWTPWVVMGAGALMLGSAGYLDWHSSRQLAAFDTDFESRCPRGCNEHEIPTQIALLRRAEAEKQAALGLYIGGSAMFVGGIAFLYVNRDRIVRTEAPQDKVFVAPLLSPHTAGVVAKIRF